MDSAYSVGTPSLFRRLTMAGFDALPPGHMMTGLLEVDVTELRQELRLARREGRPASFFASVLHSIARTLADFPEFNSMRWGMKIVTFHGVDINVPVERRVAGESVVGSLVIRGADRLTAEEITQQIELFKTADPSEETAAVQGAPFLELMLRLPRFLQIRLMRRLSSKPSNVQKLFGTTMVTSVALGGSVKGWALPPAFGSRATLFALGSVVRKPAVVAGEVLVREILNLTVQIDHDLIDGAPAARFMNALVRRLESGERFQVVQ